MCVRVRPRVLTVVVCQVEQDSDDGLHAVLHRLPHRGAVGVQLPAVALDHLLTPVQRSDGEEVTVRMRPHAEGTADQEEPGTDTAKRAIGSSHSSVCSNESQNQIELKKKFHQERKKDDSAHPDVDTPLSFSTPSYNRAAFRQRRV